MKPTCHQCGTEIAVSSPTERIGRRDTCPSCASDLRCCLNCRFYDPRLSNACREPNVEPVRDKDAGNFCDYFGLGESEGRPTADHAQHAKATDARAKLEALFRKKS